MKIDKCQDCGKKMRLLINLTGRKCYLCNKCNEVWTKKELRSLRE